MDRNELIARVKKGDFTNEKLIGWLGAVTMVTKRKPTRHKVGDVFMHTIFQHPYVLFEKRKDEWVCGLLTSEAECPEILEQCKSRFFSENYFTKVLFTMSAVTGSFQGVYDNNKQLKEIKQKLIKALI